jgi:predicted  nucleic acid-binding Zn-ribbon protein
MKNRLLFIAGIILALGLVSSRAAVTYFYAPGGDLDQTTPITLTHTGEVFIETGGSISSSSQMDSGATIWVDGVQVIFSDHSVRDGSQTAVNALWDVVLPAGPHTIRTAVTGTAAGSANNTYSYIRLEDEIGPDDQQTITNITNAYEAADTALQEAMTTLINNAVSDLQNEINATNGNVTQLQEQITALTQQVTTIQQNQSADEATIAQLQKEIADDEAVIVNLQAGQADLQNQLRTLTDLIQAHIAALQAEINSVSSQVTVLAGTTSRKLNSSNTLIYGAAGIGAAGLGVGTYILVSRPSAPAALDVGMAPADDTGSEGAVFDNAPPVDPRPDAAGDIGGSSGNGAGNALFDSSTTPTPTPIQP